MENLTKALLIAAGILIVIMVLTLVVSVWDQMVGYANEKYKNKMLEQSMKFNSKFENYSGQIVRGNELISIMNRIVDYNNYQADIQGYEKIKITINLNGHQTEFLDSSISGVEIIFDSSIINNDDDDNDIKEISELSGKLTSEANTGISGLTETKLQKLSANIHNIAYDNISDWDKKNEYIEYRSKILKQIMGREITSPTEINNIKKATYLYNQLTKFKRAMFKCKEIAYNTENGRINSMSFDVIIEDNEIKFE